MYKKMTLSETKQVMVDTFKMMYHQNMVTLFEGNISMRWEDHYLITPSQKNKETLTADMIVEIDENGQIIHAIEGCYPSTEFKMHREVYRVRPDVNAVIHDHSVFATAFATAGMPLTPAGISEINLLFGQIPLAPYGRAGSEDIYKEFKNLFNEYNAVLLENHGVIAAGKTMELAFARAETTEKTAKIMMFTKILGGENPLPDEELKILRDYGKMMRKTERESK